MVDVTMGQQDLLDRHAGLCRRRFQTIEVAARIDEGAQHRFGAPQQGAILLQWGDRDDRGLKRRVGHLAGSKVAMTGGTSFIEAETASACRSTRSTFSPASLRKFSSLQPRR